jgi:hypothetical protein
MCVRTLRTPHTSQPLGRPRLCPITQTPSDVHPTVVLLNVAHGYHMPCRSHKPPPPKTEGLRQGRHETRTGLGCQPQCLKWNRMGCQKSNTTTGRLTPIYVRHPSPRPAPTGHGSTTLLLRAGRCPPSTWVRGDHSSGSRSDGWYFRAMHLVCASRGHSAELHVLVQTCVCQEQGAMATETGFAYAPVSQAHGHNHIVQCHACCTAA